MTRVICIGECMVEFSVRPDGSYARAFAGDAYNTAVYLKRAAPEAEVQFLTATGEDEVSGEMRRAWIGEGIDGALAFSQSGFSPGLYTIDTDPTGERRFSYWRGQSAARRWLSALEARGGADTLADADLVYLSGVSLAILAPEERARALALIAELRPRVGRVAFDPNVRPSLWESARTMVEITGAAIGFANIVLPSLDDAERLWGGRDADTHLTHLAALGAEEVALTLGARGCAVVAWGSPPVRLSSPPTTVVDTSGAGDAFNGAYLAGRLEGAPAAEAARAGLSLAARVVGQRGALVA